MSLSVPLRSTSVWLLLSNQVHAFPGYLKVMVFARLCLYVKGLCHKCWIVWRRSMHWRTAVRKTWTFYTASSRTITSTHCLMWETVLYRQTYIYTHPIKHFLLYTTETDESRCCYILVWLTCFELWSKCHVRIFFLLLLISQHWPSLSLGSFTDLLMHIAHINGKSSLALQFQSDFF